MNFAFGKSAILPTCPSHNAFCAAITFQHTNFFANDAISLPAVIRTVSFQAGSLLDNSSNLQGASGIDSLQVVYVTEAERSVFLHIYYPPNSNQPVNVHLA